MLLLLRSLRASAALAGDAPVTGTSAGVLTTRPAINLTGVADATAMGIGTLTLGPGPVALIGVAQATGTAVGVLTLGAGPDLLTGTASITGAATGTLTLGPAIRLTGAAAGLATAVAVLTALPAIRLTGAAVVPVVGSGVLTTELRYALRMTAPNQTVRQSPRRTVERV